ncbi:MAG: O-acetyl-ADP-ribose deacetylase [Spirochaetes bacterium]|nr:O-acetyl-ADP-ribose deacetylase [Spirochaetota bacterium]
MKLIGEYLGGRLVVEVGDITQFSGGAIVNAANSGLLGGSGVDGAIHTAGGPAILAECRALRAGSLKDGLLAGQAVATTAGRLGADYVIHTVGPVWAGGGRGEPELLASCYRESLALADKFRLDSIAFPAISTGVYGYPKALAAKVVFKALSRYAAVDDWPRHIYLVFFSEQDARIFVAASGVLPT